MDVAIVTGMHRSYTSLLAQYLGTCGLFLGENLIGPSFDNRDGYFENEAIVGAHHGMIRESKRNIFTAGVFGAFTESAKKVIVDELKRGRGTIPQGRVFAFKDPRACLFLHAWKNMLPRSKYIFIYRDYRQTIGSLFRRGSDRVLYLRPWVAARAWLLYNACILEFCARHPDDCVLIDGNGFRDNAKRCVDVVNDRFGMRLDRLPVETVYKQEYTSAASAFPFLAAVAVAPYRSRLDVVQRELKEVSGV